MEKNILSDVLRLLRIANDLSITELANKIGVSKSYVSELERGLKKRPSLDLIDKYSEALNVDKQTIMFFIDDFSNSQKEQYQIRLFKILKKLIEKKEDN